jgi:hypothetical protein
MFQASLRLTAALSAVLAALALPAFADSPAARMALERIDASGAPAEIASSEGLVFLDVYADW